jgi:hypothetical protein
LRRGVTALLAALRRGTARPGPPSVLRRGRLGGVVHLSVTITAEPRAWGRVVRALAAAIAEAAQGRTLGQVALVTGEPPIVGVFRGRKDVAAARVVGALTAGAAHRRPTLWLSLSEGTYLAQAVDPERPFVAAPEVVADIVRKGQAVCALVTDAAPCSGAVALVLEVFAAPAEMRVLLRLASRHLADVMPRRAITR